MSDALTPTLGRVEAAEKRERAWKHTAWVFIGLFMCAVGYSWWLGWQTKVVLHVTEVDPDGKPLSSGQPGAYTLDDVKIMNNLQEWIIWTRWRTDEATPVVESMWHKKAQDMTDKQASEDVKRFFAQVAQDRLATRANPFRVQLSEFVREKEAPNVYRLWWHETWTPKYGGGAKVMRMSAVLTTELRTSYGVLGPYLRVGDEHRSPTGLFIVGVSWIRQEESS